MAIISSRLNTEGDWEVLTNSELDIGTNSELDIGTDSELDIGGNIHQIKPLVPNRRLPHVGSKRP